MGATAIKTNIIQMPTLQVIDGGAKLRKDGKPKRTINNQSEERWVWPIRDKEDIKLIINNLYEEAKNAKSEKKRQMCYRNFLLFVIGINVGLRVSDLLQLKWEHVLERDMNTFRTAHAKREKKTGKIKTICPNSMMKRAIEIYLTETGIEPEPDDYIFIKTTGGLMTDAAVEKIVKKATACIEGNYNTHSLRKTYAYQKFMMLADNNDPMALVKVQKDLNHRNSSDTARYLGITREDAIESSEQLGDFLMEDCWV